MGIWFSKNGVQGTTEQAPAGHPVYVVTAANGATMRTDVSSLAMRIAAEWAIYPPTTSDRRQIESPLPAVERCASGLSSGASLTMPTAPQARVMRAADGRPGDVRGYVLRGQRTEDGCQFIANVRELRGLARRGWLELDHPIRPSYGMLTDSGRRALERYEAKHGTPVGAR